MRMVPRGTRAENRGGLVSEELYFNDELRKCLNAVGLSDCGENDQWNYWYQRLHKAHDVAVDRVTETQRSENAKLREERDHWHVEQVHAYGNWEDAHKRATELEAENAKLRELVQYICDECYGDDWFVEKAAELGIEGHY